MRILYVINYYKPAYGYGGPVRSISQLCEALAKLGATVTVLTTNANGMELLDVPLASPTTVDGVEVFYYPIVPISPRSFFYSPSLAKAIHQKVVQFDIAVLDTFFTHPMGPAVFACKQGGVPYIVPLRGALLPWALKHKRLKKKLYLSLIGRAYLNGAAALHFTASSEAQAVKKLRLTAPKLVVPNGLDSHRFAHLPVRGALRKRLNIPEQAHLLLFLGRLHVKKRPDIAVEALAAAQSLPGETHLVLVGPDEMQMIPKLRAQAQNFGCADRFHITGLLKGDEILLALADADLLLMPSEPESENFGMSAVEAMAAGLPVLVSDGVSVGYWAQAAGAGRSVPGTPDAFRKAACELLTLPPYQLKEMGRKGQILIGEKFDSVIVAQQMLRQYQAIVSNGGPVT